MKQRYIRFDFNFAGSGYNGYSSPAPDALAKVQQQLKAALTPEVIQALNAEHEFHILVGTPGPTQWTFTDFSLAGFLQNSADLPYDGFGDVHLNKNRLETLVANEEGAKAAWDKAHTYKPQSIEDVRDAILNELVTIGVRPANQTLEDQKSTQEAILKFIKETTFPKKHKDFKSPIEAMANYAYHGKYKDAEHRGCSKRSKAYHPGRNNRDSFEDYVKWSERRAPTRVEINTKLFQVWNGLKKEGDSSGRRRVAEAFALNNQESLGDDVKISFK